MKILIILLLICGFILCACLAVVNKRSSDQIYDDAAQEQFGKEYRKKKEIQKEHMAE